MNVLVTGGAGYIGSHVVAELQAAGHQPVVFDNFSHSRPEVLQQLGQITGVKIPLVQADVRDYQAVLAALNIYRIEAVIHLAGLKVVGESLIEPLSYYEVNVHGTGVLMQALEAAGVFHLVFSSSAAIYGKSDVLPVHESQRANPSHPYGRSKWHAEQMLTDLAASNDRWHLVGLRYFNPVGCHPSVLIGEAPSKVASNLMPAVARVAAGLQPEVAVFGQDYPTVDGTGVRDFIHVRDLAQGHLAALSYLAHHPGWDVFNLGTGRGVSVLELISAFERACGHSIAYRIASRRPGDIAASFADVTKARQILGWVARHDLAAQCASAWDWQRVLSAVSS